ncbi:unnamed protein product [Brassica rapa subsp. trilocularis]
MTKLHNMRAYEDGHLLSILFHTISQRIIRPSLSPTYSARVPPPEFVDNGGDSGDNNHGGNSVPRICMLKRIEGADVLGNDNLIIAINPARRSVSSHVFVSAFILQFLLLLYYDCSQFL